MIVNKTRIHQVLLFRFDEIPIGRLTQLSVRSQLGELFNFAEVDLAQDSSSGKTVVDARSGALKDELSTIILIRMQIEERRILLDVDGTSGDAERITARLRKFLSDLSGRQEPEFLQPVHKAEDSQIIARLEFGAGRIISEQFAGFVESEVGPATSQGLAKGVVSLSRVAFDVRYMLQDMSLDDYRITISPKQFILGPRPGLPLEEQVYFSQAPVDTATHIELLRKLESRLMNSSSHK